MTTDTHGIVALILSVGVVAVVIILAIETVLHSGAISESEATVLSTLVGAIAGILGSYIGVSARTRQTNGDSTGVDDAGGDNGGVDD
jgi:Na+/H+-translocating membrane pyrophosphatase